MRTSLHLPPSSDGALAGVVRRLSGAAARRPRLTISLWLLLVASCVAGGMAAGTKTLTNSQTGVGESARADQMISAAHLTRPAQENILVRSSSAATTESAVRSKNFDDAQRAAICEVASTRPDLASARAAR